MEEVIQPNTNGGQALLKLLIESDTDHLTLVKSMRNDH